MTERDKVVAYLRGSAKEEGRLWETIGDTTRRVRHHARCVALDQAADEIANGAHLTFKPEPTIPASEWTKTPSAR